MEQDAQQAMVNLLFPHVHLVTPNRYEAEALLGRTLDSTADVEQGARDLLAMGARAVLIKGGHMGDDDGSPFAQDYFLSSQSFPDEPRNCDGGIWLRSTRYNTVHTHGTGCTLSSALATALALQTIQWPTLTDLIDATTLAKAYVTAGISQGVGLGQGPGPVGQTSFPQSHQHFPRILFNPNEPTPPPFVRLARGAEASTGPGIGKILILVDSLEWIQKLVQVEGVTDVQLRIKGETDHTRIVALIQKCNQLCERAGVRLWINDYWEAAIEAGCFGVHMGQEDLYRCQQKDGLAKLREAGLALGLSTHSYGELAAALAVEPSYISLGPIFGTTSKEVNFGPQGLAMVQQWRRLVPLDVPLVVIGGITDTDRTTQVQQAGADCAAMIGAVTKAEDVAHAVKSLTQAMETAPQGR
jgi:thiamine-phosphate diphosphorylase